MYYKHHLICYRKRHAVEENQIAARILSINWFIGVPIEAHVNSTPVTMVRSSFYHLFYFVFLFSNCILRITASHIPGESPGSSQEVAFFVFDHSELLSENSGDDL